MTLGQGFPSVGLLFPPQGLPDSKALRTATHASLSGMLYPKPAMFLRISHPKINKYVRSYGEGL